MATFLLRYSYTLKVVVNLPFAMVTVAVVEFVESAYTASEGDGIVEVCLRIDRQVSTPIGVRLTPSPDTAEG